MTISQSVIARLLAPVLAGLALGQATPALASGGGGAVGSAPSTTGTTSSSGSGSGSGGGGLPSGGLAPVASTPTSVPPPPSKHAKGSWIKGVSITQYWPAPESWFVGRMVATPGVPGLHRIDWLYSATGLSMEGSGIGLDGRMYHIDELGDGGWVTATGAATSPSNGWSAGAPYWRAGGYWRNRKHAVTFPLSAGGWSDGRGAKYVPLRDVSFAAGASLPLHYYQSIAVDPGVIPLGSRVYVPAYRNDGYGGWFVAQDTGGAIKGRHIDVYRSPPSNALDVGSSLSSQRIFVIKAKH